MTSNGTPGSDRLDRVEAILAEVAQRQAEAAAQQQASDRRLAATQAIVDSNARAIEANSAEVAAQRQDFDRRLAATQAIVDSNARAIEANSAEAAIQRAAQAANEQTITNAVLGMLDMGEGLMARLDEFGVRMDQFGVRMDEFGRRFDEHNQRMDEHSRRLDEHSRRIEDLYRAQGHILRRLFGEDLDTGDGQE